MPRLIAATLAATLVAASPAGAEDLATFDSAGLPGSQGVVVRLRHPSHWKAVRLDDEMALAELRGTQGGLTGILQVGRGGRHNDVQALCKPERARTLLQGIDEAEPGTRVTDVVARNHEGRPGFEVRYERKNPATFLVVRSVIVCLKDSRLLVSCGGEGRTRAAAAAIEPVCRQVIDSLSIRED